MKKATSKLIKVIISASILLSLSGCVIVEKIQEIVGWEIDIVEQSRLLTAGDDGIEIKIENNEYIWVVNVYDGLTYLDIVDYSIVYANETEIIEYGAYYPSQNNTDWKEYKDNIQCVYVKVESDYSQPVSSMEGWFEDMQKLIRVSIYGLKTEEGTSAENCFKNCSGMQEFIFEKIDFSGITNANSMFESCNGMLTIDLSDLTNSKVTAESIVKDCAQLKTVIVSTDKIASQLPTEYKWTYNDAEFIPGETVLYENGSGEKIKLSCKK